MRSERGALARDGFLGPTDGGGKADAVLRSLDVVVHGFRNADYANSIGIELLCKAERIVAADGDEIVQTEMSDVVDDDRREVVRFGGNTQRFGFLRGQVLRQ